MPSLFTDHECKEWNADRFCLVCGLLPEDGSPASGSNPPPAPFDPEGDEYYTPDNPYMIAVRRTIGDIELDPASCARANANVKASRIHTRENDGLAHDWLAATLYLNPPFEKNSRPSAQARWTAYALDQYRRSMFRLGMLCVNFRPSEKWFRPLTHFPIACPDHRIPFENPGGVIDPRHASAFVLLPDDVALGLGVRHGNCVMNPTHRLIERFIANFAPFCSMIYLPNAIARDQYDEAHKPAESLVSE